MEVDFAKNRMFTNQPVAFLWGMWGSQKVKYEDDIGLFGFGMQGIMYI